MAPVALSQVGAVCGAGRRDSQWAKKDQRCLVQVAGKSSEHVNGKVAAMASWPAQALRYGESLIGQAKSSISVSARRLPGWLGETRVLPIGFITACTPPGMPWDAFGCCQGTASSDLW
jgi:hypothetical protein